MFLAHSLRGLMRVLRPDGQVLPVLVMSIEASLIQPPATPLQLLSMSQYMCLGLLSVPLIQKRPERDCGASWRISLQEQAG
ncbi:hypothetical protein GBAR_LOCUS14594 [Geodia barretti]|uniref:Uncharacterized protein n=1 Tax=Geodia barretti TaxID=519541 RepID=A0AA35SB11_GEOBA|nr:hypothetical protein GBAR_LOCUS14594 [Geodia barretti]